MPDQLLVRPATPADAPGIARVHVASFRDTYHGLMPQPFLDDFTIERRTQAFQRLLADPQSTVWVACRDDTIRGFVSTSTTDDLPPDVGEIKAIYVEPSAVGTGVGRALMATAMDALRAAGSREIILWVHPHNPVARTFYEKAGLHHDGGTMSVELGGASIPHVRYRATLYTAGQLR